MNPFSLSDYTYTLPDELIAQEAIHPHHDAKMMIIERGSGKIQRETTFRELSNILTENDILFFNNSRVVRSRIPLHQTKYKTKNWYEWIIKDGEIFFLRNGENNEFEALIRPGNKIKEGTEIFFRPDIRISVLENTLTGRKLKLHGENIYTLLEIYWQLPLPPYIEYTKTKEEDYQTIFAKKEWSVAAPTASLHFTQELLESIPSDKEFVTLHVWLWTFKGIDTEDIRKYAIHKEVIEIEKNLFTKIARIKLQRKNIIGVGTTVCRTLESLPYIWNELDIDQKKNYPPEVQIFWNQKILNSYEWSIISNLVMSWENIFCETQIYITPGYSFLIIDDLITNFHLPQSSLLVLVSAFIGYIPTMKIYQYAIENRYRFFSFWDGMYIRNRSS
jgi:S-adenosylmethionine:tRNA ribosyltransferase-isomerase